MSSALLGLALLVGFLIADRAAQRRDGGRRRWVLPLYGLVVAFAGTEFARWDHGHPDWVLSIGFVGAPIVVIFGGALEGARRWYGWPDLGPAPGRLALVGAFLLAGVLGGQGMKGADVLETTARGHAIARSIRSWRDAHGGALPGTLSEAVPEVVTTRMGSLSPPPFSWDPAKGILSFPVRTGAPLLLDVSDPNATWRAP